MGENPNKSLEGIKTVYSDGFVGEVDLVKTLINPWKGLKLKQIEEAVRQARR